MALIKSCLASGAANAPAMMFGVLGNDFFNSPHFYGTDTITATGLATASTQELVVSTGGYETLTLNGTSVQYSSFACKGIKADGTELSLTRDNNVIDVSDCVLVVATFFTESAFSAALS